MKKLIFSFALIFIAASLNLKAQDADKVKGYWLTDEGTSQIYIFKAKNGSYYGKIVWLDEPNEFGAPKKDKENPDDKLKDRPLLDLLLLTSFEYDAKDEEWVEGVIYDAKSGKTYDCYMWFEDGNEKELKIKGFLMGMRFIGKETTWTREDGKR